MSLMKLVPLVLAMLSLSSASNFNSSSSGNNLLGVYIERAPESAVAPKGDEVVFECELNLKPDRLEWRFRPSASDPYRYLHPAAGYNVTSSNEERTWKLRIYVSAQTLGDYQCLAWYGPGAIASTPARLTLASISIDNPNGYVSQEEGKWSVAPKNCVLLRCGSVTSNPPSIWSFYRNGEKLPQTELLPGASGALVLNSVTAKDAGNYTCAATNAITGVELRLPQVIDLRVDYTDRTAPYFLHPKPATQVEARPGDTVVLECPGLGSPRPGAVWSSPNVPKIYHNRSRLLAYGLQISDIQPEDQGSYVCLLDNGIAPVLVHMIKLSVLERPHILQGPNATLTNEGESLSLECIATGHPQPEIYWLFNGEDASADNETLIEHNRLLIHHVQKRHAGVVQCFALNQLGETSEGNMLRVNPLQISGEDYQPLGNVPMRSAYEPGYGNGNGVSSSSSPGSRSKGKRKYMRVANMVPPSRPNVTRLANDAVMLRWNVPENDGLPIQFFKVQYRMLGDSSRKIPRENWQTTNENIPYGKTRERERDRERERERDRNRDRERDHHHETSFKNFTSSVTGLRPDRNYRFRIIAVYSNNDNKEGNTSIKFFLQRGSAKSNLPVPELREIEASTDSSVLLHWTLSGTQADSIDGYYAYYRPADSAAEYLKATVDGGHARKFRLGQLEPNTAYEFKLQSFNAYDASDFSAIKQARTWKSSGHLPSATPTSVAPVLKGSGQQQENSIYPVIAGAAGGGLLLLIATVVACLCVRRRNNAQPEDENKPQLDHIQADFVTSAVLGVAPHHNHKTGDVRRLNGVIPRMNITPNPLAQDPTADKNRNVMELRFLPPNGTASSPAGIKNLPSSTVEHSNSEPDADVDAEVDVDIDIDGNGNAQTGPSSSCETLEACDPSLPLSLSTSTEAPSKPLPPLPLPLPKKRQQQQQQQVNSNALAVAAAAALHQPGLHHAQPYHAPGTPTLLQKRHDYQQQLQQQQQQSSPPPPVPPHAAYYQQQQQMAAGMGGASPMLDQQRRTLERSVRSLQQQQQQHHYALEDGGLPTSPPTTTRIPSLRRQRRASGSQHNSHTNLNNNHHNNNNINNNNNLQHHLLHHQQQQHLHHQLQHHPSHHMHHNGGNGSLVGIPIVPGSPRVQRSPMPARALIKRTRLGSHTDNISSGSLNSIEV